MLIVLALLDGMPLQNGRFAGGPTTVLTLDAEQIRSLAAERHLILSSEQRAALSKATGVAPRWLFMYDTRIGENDCACDAENRGLRFSAAQFEVPHAYLRESPGTSFGGWLALTLMAALPLLVGAGRRIAGA